MNFEQAAIVALLVAMFAIFASERFRVEVVALSGLATAFVLGLVPAEGVFAGFSNPAVITVMEILLIVNVLTRTRVIERFAGALVDRAQTERTMLAMLCLMGAGISVFMNNIGALALMFPVALSVCARLDIPTGRVLMPLSFATLLGGLCSLTGTPANLVVNDWMINETGEGFAYFDMGMVGGPVVLAGIALLVFAAPRALRSVRSAGAAPPEPGPGAFLSEVSVPRGSALAGTGIDAAEQGTGLRIHGILRDGQHVFARRDRIVLQAGDVLLVEGEVDRLDAMCGAGGGLKPARFAEAGAERLEIVVMPESTILGSRIGALEALAERGIAVLGLASRLRRIEGRFDDLQLGLGDVLILEGDGAALREAAGEAGVLPLSFRRPARNHPDALRSLALFGLGIAATAFGLAPPEIAFGAVIVVMALFGTLRLRSALQDLNWPIIILLACMIPLGMAIEQTGAAQVIASGIVSQLPSDEPILIVAAVLLLAVVVTPFVDNVSTAAVLSPIAVSIAASAGIPIAPLLIAVALGASLDFLTPFGHHNNAVVMGAAGYRFVDFPRLGLPLLAACLTTGLIGIWQMWM